MGDMAGTEVPSQLKSRLHNQSIPAPQHTAAINTGSE